METGKLRHVIIAALASFFALSLAFAGEGFVRTIFLILRAFITGRSTIAAENSRCVINSAFYSGR